MDFNGKVVVVTGAAKGIGKSIAVSFGKEKAFVVASDLNEKDCIDTVKEIEKAGGKAIAVKCNVSVKKEADEMISLAVKKFGKIDVLINNAGIYPFNSFLEMTEAQWSKVIDVNLKGVFYCAQAAAKQIVKQKTGGKIINITSIASFLGFAGLTHYCASKGGINGFTRALAMELAPYKINVNAIAPGPIKTPGLGNVDESMMKGILSQVPLERIGLPEDIANAALFLASNESDYITGQVLTVDGGYSIH